jgi:hypothetical protein
MEMTTRAVGRELGLGQAATARVVAAGLVGPSRAVAGAHLYHADRVEALARRPLVEEDTPLPPSCRDGVIVVRTNPLVDGPLSTPRRLATGRAAVLRVLLAERGYLPMVVTVAGFVVTGADVTGVRTDDSEPPMTTLVTRPATDWFEAFEGHRLMTGAGDPWLFWRCRLCPQLPRGRPRHAA